jgi:stearoyl-CoA desaturase (delta-9 desaturase)
MTLAGLGVTVGFHRLFTHRSFRTARWLRALFGILGSAAVEGPVIEWVAYHRRHRAFAAVLGLASAALMNAGAAGLLLSR